MSNEKRLYRSRTDRVFGGVCAGLGDFFGIDPSLMRLMFVFVTIFGFGSMVVIYLAMLLVIPEEPLEAPVIESIVEPTEEKTP
jgi:phage shock protein PspC (stress-responsive transcriptional regulator)